MTAALLWGKLPAHGDFIARGLLPDQRDALDLWLAGSLAQARQQLADTFEDTYDEAPPWRFAWEEAGGWTAGAMAPSTDGVGRRYPILVALSDLGGEQVEHAADMVENLIYDALGGEWDADRLHAAASVLAPEPLTAWEGGAGWWTLGAERFNEAYVIGARPADLMRVVLTRAPGGQNDA